MEKKIIITVGEVDYPTKPEEVYKAKKDFGFIPGTRCEKLLSSSMRKIENIILNFQDKINDNFLNEKEINVYVAFIPFDCQKFNDLQREDQTNKTKYISFYEDKLLFCTPRFIHQYQTDYNLQKYFFERFKGGGYSENFEKAIAYIIVNEIIDHYKIKPLKKKMIS